MYDDWKYQCGQMCRPAHRSHHQARFVFGECPRKPIIPESLLPTVIHGGRSVMIWAAVSWYATGLINYSGRITTSDYMDLLGH